MTEFYDDILEHPRDIPSEGQEASKEFIQVANILMRLEKLMEGLSEEEKQSVKRMLDKILEK